MRSELVSPNLLRTSVTQWANVLTIYILRHAFLVCKKPYAPCHCRIGTALLERFDLASTSSLSGGAKSSSIHCILNFHQRPLVSNSEQTRYEPHTIHQSPLPLSFRVAFPIALTKWTTIATSIIHLTRLMQEKRRRTFNRPKRGSQS